MSLHCLGDSNSLTLNFSKIPSLFHVLRGPESLSSCSHLRPHLIPDFLWLQLHYLLSNSLSMFQPRAFTLTISSATNVLPPDFTCLSLKSQLKCSLLRETVFKILIHHSPCDTSLLYFLEGICQHILYPLPDLFIGSLHPRP